MFKKLLLAMLLVGAGSQFCGAMQGKFEEVVTDDLCKLWLEEEEAQAFERFIKERAKESDVAGLEELRNVTIDRFERILSTHRGLSSFALALAVEFFELQVDRFIHKALRDYLAFYFQFWQHRKKIKETERGPRSQFYRTLEAGRLSTKEQYFFVPRENLLKKLFQKFFGGSPLIIEEYVKVTGVIDFLAGKTLSKGELDLVEKLKDSQFQAFYFKYSANSFYPSLFADDVLGLQILRRMFYGVISAIKAYNKLKREEFFLKYLPDPDQSEVEERSRVVALSGEKRKDLGVGASTVYFEQGSCPILMPILLLNKEEGVEPEESGEDAVLEEDKDYPENQ